MIYYKDTNNEVYAYDNKVDNTTLTEITEDEAILITNPPATDSEIFTYNKKYKQEEITRLFNETAEAISNALPHEMASWRKQEEEARAYKNYIVNGGAEPDTPFISSLVVTRDLGETVEELSDKIIDNADVYQVIYSSLLGKFQNRVKAIDLATTTAELQKIVWQ